MSAKSGIILFGYVKHREFICKTSLKKKHSAECKFCHISITETSGTTSNFYRHLKRKHKERFLDYKAGQEVTDTAQPSVMPFTQRVQMYNPTSPRQRAITEAIIKDLIIGSSLPLSAVESEPFRHFLKVLDNKYTPVSSAAITDKHIPVLVSKVKNTITEKLQSHTSLSVTVDIWSDRIPRSFLGVTAQVLSTKHSPYALEFFLLDCRCFAGKHTSENIAASLDEIADEYGITDKISYVITGNAENMKCAFKVTMPQRLDERAESEEEAQPFGDEQLWQDRPDSGLDSDLLRSRERLSCFHHSLQLVIHDGMKQVKALSPAIAKATKFSTLLHSSMQFKDTFEATFGSGKTVPAATSTRWNSTYKQVQAIVALDHKGLTEMCSEDFDTVVFNLCEWTQLKELCDILAPFSEATDLTEGEQCVTISMVVPTILDLNTHLHKMEETRTQCRPLIRALRESLLKRFSGIFVKANMAKQNEAVEEPFGSDVYFLATMLDPQFGISWIDLDVNITGSETTQKKTRDELKKTLTDILVTKVESVTTDEIAMETSAAKSPEDSPPEKFPRLLTKYRAHRNRRSHKHLTNALLQVTKYLETIQEGQTDNALTFWPKNKDKFPQLHVLAIKLLSVPASSAPVERVFSTGGLLTRPHRARLGHQMLQTLLYLKCNSTLL